MLVSSIASQAAYQRCGVEVGVEQHLLVEVELADPGPDRVLQRTLAEHVDLEVDVHVAQRRRHLNHQQRILLVDKAGREGDVELAVGEVLDRLDPLGVNSRSPSTPMKITSILSRRIP